MLNSTHKVLTLLAVIAFCLINAAPMESREALGSDNITPYNRDEAFAMDRTGRFKNDIYLAEKYGDITEGAHDNNPERELQFFKEKGKVFYDDEFKFAKDFPQNRPKLSFKELAKIKVKKTLDKMIGYKEYDPREAWKLKKQREAEAAALAAETSHMELDTYLEPNHHRS